MFKVDHSLLLNNLKRNKKSSYGVLITIAIFEIIMVIYGIAIFDFSDYFRIIYFVSYFVILLVSIVSIVLLYIYSKPKNKHKFHFAYYYSYFYVTLLGLWSCLISFLDTYRGNFPFTFLTVFIAIPFFCLIDPILYSSYAVVGTIAIIIANSLYIKNNALSFNYGYVINILIFLAIVIFVTIKSYQVVVERNKNEETLKIQSLTDQLTEVFNRRALDIKVNELVKAVDKTNYSLILIDIDKFKDINDKYGHTYGDKCLRKVVDIIKKYFSSLSIYRYGGDEFIVTTTLNEDEITYLFNQVNNELKTLDNEVKLQISAGVYNISSDDKEDVIFSKVDKALYEAKLIGKGRCIFFNSK